MEGFAAREGKACWEVFITEFPFFALKLFRTLGV
jgi:hypothetical protein